MPLDYSSKTLRLRWALRLKQYIETCGRSPTKRAAFQAQSRQHSKTAIMKASDLLALVLSSTASALVAFPITSKSPCFASRPTVMLKVPVYDPNCFACRDGATPPEWYVSKSSWLTALANCVAETREVLAGLSASRIRLRTSMTAFTHCCHWMISHLPTLTPILESRIRSSFWRLARSLRGVCQVRGQVGTQNLCMLWTFWRVDCQYTEDVRKLDEFLTSCQID